MKTRTFIALLATAIALQAQAVVQILPAGEFAARDGRPGPGKSWKLSDEDGAKLAADLTAASQKTAFVFDYEHQTFRAEANGQPAPAAGWATTFEWRPGQGLYATDVKWTDKARLAIEGDEYRYISPVLVYEKATGRVIGVINAAITNTPALAGMDSVSTPAALSLAAALAAQFTNDEPLELPMTLAQLLIAALGLKTETTETEIVTAVATLKTRAEKAPTIPEALAAALGVKPDGDAAIAVTAIETLKAKANTQPDQVATEAIAALQRENAELRGKQSGNEVTALVEANLGKKLAPALKDWAIGLGNRDLAALKKFINDAPDLNLGTTQTGGKDPSKGGGDKTLSAEEQAVCAQLGLKPEEFIKNRTPAAA